MTFFFLNFIIDILMNILHLENVIIQIICFKKKINYELFSVHDPWILKEGINTETWLVRALLLKICSKYINLSVKIFVNTTKIFKNIFFSKI